MTKITFNSMFKPNQKVWTVDYDGDFFRIKKHQIIGFECYLDNNEISVNYILDDEDDSKSYDEIFNKYEDALNSIEE